jgi:hypothetical protein
MWAPSANASASVAAAPGARTRSHQRATWSSDRKKFSVCQSDAEALARTSPRRPTHAIASW